MPWSDALGGNKSSRASRPMYGNVCFLLDGEHKKNCLTTLISLDTEFHEIYTFVSCTRACCSIDQESIGRIGKWQPRKQPRRSLRRQPRRSKPTKGKRRTGDASSVPRSAFVLGIYCTDAVCAVFGVERYPDTRFFSMLFTTISYST